MGDSKWIASSCSCCLDCHSILTSASSLSSRCVDPLTVTNVFVVLGRVTGAGSVVNGWNEIKTDRGDVTDTVYTFFLPFPLSTTSVPAWASVSLQSFHREFSGTQLRALLLQTWLKGQGGMARGWPKWQMKYWVQLLRDRTHCIAALSLHGSSTLWLTISALSEKCIKCPIFRRMMLAREISLAILFCNTLKLSQVIKQYFESRLNV